MDKPRRGVDWRQFWTVLALAAASLGMWTLIVLAVLALVGCSAGVRDGGRGGGEDGAEWSILALLRHIGIGVTWVGVIGAITGIALRLLAVIYPSLAGFAFVFTGIALWGGAAAGVGTAVTVIANPWVMVPTIATIVGGVLFWHWPDIRAAWYARSALSRKVDKIEAAQNNDGVKPAPK